MTKKTNSLLFRLGINSLWHTKSINFNKIFNDLRLEKTLHNELIKRQWNILSVKWGRFSTNIWVYNSFVVSKMFKQNIFRYYKATQNIIKVAEKFSLNSNYLVSILKKIRISKKNSNKSICCVKLRTNIIIFLYKIWKIGFFLKILSETNFFNWIKLNLIIESFFVVNFKISSWSVSLTKKNSLVRDRLQKINGYLYFKILNIFMQNILFNITKRFISIAINNIWNNEGWVFKQMSANSFIIQLLFLSCFYNNITMFSEFISLQLKRNKNHKKTLRQITLAIESFWKSRKLGLRGLQLRVTGKLNGKMRRSKYHYSIGKVELQTLETFLNYTMSVSYTKFGIISTKFWIIHGNKKL